MTSPTSRVSNHICTQAHKCPHSLDLSQEAQPRQALLRHRRTWLLRVRPRGVAARRAGTVSRENTESRSDPRRCRAHVTRACGSQTQDGPCWAHPTEQGTDPPAPFRVSPRALPGLPRAALGAHTSEVCATLSRAVSAACCCIRPSSGHQNLPGSMARMPLRLREAQRRPSHTLKASIFQAHFSPHRGPKAPAT